MFQLLKTTQFDFMGKRKALLTLSAVLMLASIGLLFVKGLNLGIEFTGGTEIRLKFAESADVAEIRSALSGAGMKADVTTLGAIEDNEIYIRLAVAETGAEKVDPTQQVLEALHGRFDDASASSMIDLNTADAKTVREVLLTSPDISADDAEGIAEGVLAQRKEAAIFASLDDLSAVEGMTATAREVLDRSAVVGPMALRSQSYIGPAIGRELMRSATIAIVGSLLGMLLYIWIRFQLDWGFAAVAALTHDTVIVLGLASLFGAEISLPVVAAFLTLVGYSVNDTVVVFDRVRENLRKQQGKDLATVINASINQTLSRTIITSGLTWIVVFGLWLFGGAALKPFAFVLTAGVIIGTYSSIYIASPILVLWKQYFGDRKSQDDAGQATGQAKKIPSSSAG
ncbi:MAG: protein translocase subunit SecF [bacterium]|nr:protein translocase subunit SecF [bacterium]